MVGVWTNIIPQPWRRLLRAFHAEGAWGRGDPEEQRRSYLVSAICALGFLFLAIFSAVNFLDGHKIMAALLAASAGILGAGFFFILRTGRHQPVSGFLVLTLTSMLFYLLDSGGREQTGPLWFYIYYPIPILCFGMRSGMVINLVTLGGAAFLLRFDNGSFLATQYSSAFKLRFLASNLVVLVLTALFEQARINTHLAMVRIRRKLDRISRTDVLTGLPNRREIEQRLRYEAVRAARHARHFSILIADLDHFKLVNDNFGHLAGDHVLREVSRLLRTAVRKEDSVGRWGGEEFLMLLPETGLQGAAMVAENLRMRIEQTHIHWHGRRIPLTCSIGVAYWDMGTLENLLRQADHGLYEAKRTGRNRVVLYRQETDPGVQQSLLDELLVQQSHSVQAEMDLIQPKLTTKPL